MLGPALPALVEELRNLVESDHARQLALMKWLSQQAKRLGVGEHVYVVGGAVRNWVLKQPIKDIDMMIDTVALKGKDSEWLSKELQKVIPAETSLATNNYGVAILTIKGDWKLDGVPMAGEVIEIANARKESYGGAGGKGYKPSTVEPATAQVDVARREFTFNTLMWKLAQLADGPDKADIIDLTGCGLQDLKSGTMRCPSDPDKTFADDPTRMLRALKFLQKYGFKPDPQTRAAIQRNAEKLKHAPVDAIAALLTDTLLADPKTVLDILREMDALGLFSVVADMTRTNATFNTRMQRWALDLPLEIYFGVLDAGLALDERIRFLSVVEQRQFRAALRQLSPAEQVNLLAALKQPGKSLADKLFVPNLAKELGQHPRAVGELLTKVARAALLNDPALLRDPARLQGVVTQQVRAGLGATEARQHVIQDVRSILDEA